MAKEIKGPVRAPVEAKPALSPARESLRSALSLRDSLLSSLDQVHAALARLDAALADEAAARLRVEELEAQGAEAAAAWSRRPGRGGNANVDMPFEELAQARRELATAIAVAAAAKVARKKLESERRDVLKAHRAVSIDVVDSLRGVLRETAADIRSELFLHRSKAASCAGSLRALTKGFQKIRHPDESRQEGAAAYAEDVRRWLVAENAAAGDEMVRREQAAIAFAEDLTNDPDAKFERGAR